MNPWLLIIWGIAQIGIILGAFHIGGEYRMAGVLEENLTRAEKTLVRVKVERVIEERVVTKWRDREKVIVVKAEEVKHEIPVFVSSDCVLPADFIVQLHAISRGTTVAALGLTADAGTGAGCRAALEALRQSYANHYLDAAQLNAILEREAELEKP